MNWQPIDTAPKGEVVLLLKQDRNEVTAGIFLTTEDADDRFPWLVLDESQDSGLNGWQNNEHGPTHWMPLPSPQTEGGTK